MTFEELQTHWQQLDRKIDRLQSTLTRQVLEPQTRRRIHRLAVGPALDIAFSAAILMLAIAVAGNHTRESRVLLPAGIVLCGAVALLVSSARQLKTILELDWSGTVARIQATLERLRIQRIQQFQGVMLLAPLMGFCGLILAIVGLMDCGGGDPAVLFDRVDPNWVTVNYVFGLLFIPAGYLTARFLSARCSGRAWWKSVLDGIAGTTLTAARKDLDAWTQPV